MSSLTQVRMPWRLEQWMARQHLAALRGYYDWKVRTTRPYATGEESGNFEVHVLLGHKYVGMCLWSVKSFLQFCGKRYTVVLHDDGTLNDKDIAILEKHLPKVEILRREAADRLMHGMLEGFPHALRYRFGRLRRSESSLDPHVFSLKLLDFNLLSKASKILALDTDVLFFRKPIEITEWIDDEGQTGSLYCRELWAPIRNASNRIVRFEKKEEPPAGFNSGLICLHRSTFELAVLDQWLQTNLGLVETEYTFEQQAYNFLVRRSTGHGALPGATYTFNFNDAACAATHFGIKSLFFANLPRILKELR